MLAPVPVLVGHTPSCHILHCSCYNLGIHWLLFRSHQCCQYSFVFLVFIDGLCAEFWPLMSTQTSRRPKTVCRKWASLMLWRSRESIHNFRIHIDQFAWWCDNFFIFVCGSCFALIEYKFCGTIFVVSSLFAFLMFQFTISLWQEHSDRAFCQGVFRNPQNIAKNWSQTDQKSCKNCFKNTLKICYVCRSQRAEFS